MATLSKHNSELNERGEGKCSVPMWSGGIPSGFCDEPAFSRHKGGEYFEGRNGERHYLNGAYDGYVPALACPAHGGKTKEEALNLCSYCRLHPSTCESNPKFGTGKGKDNVYECDKFQPPLKELNNL